MSACLFAVVDLAAQDDLEFGYITALVGSGGRYGVDGDQINSTMDRRFREAEHVLRPGDELSTNPGGRMVIGLPAADVSIQLEESSAIEFVELSVVDTPVPAALTLLAGRMVVSTGPGGNESLIVGGKTNSAEAYLFSRGASVAVMADGDELSFYVLNGQATFQQGELDEEGRMANGDGEPIGTGQWVSTTDGLVKDTGAPTRLTAIADASYQDDLFFEFALGAGAYWIERAEKGDLTPVRTAARGQLSVLPSAGLAPEFTFDQPMAGIIAPVSRAGTQPVRSQAISPVQVALESGRPASVVVAQRQLRTRIIGSPGTASGPIQFNRNAEVLIQIGR